jgi:LmbE family N-acetylglucosaminyl deacetylase
VSRVSFPGAFGRTLVLAPHTDDAELGCGGTLARAVEEQSPIHVAVFSTVEDSIPSGLPADTLEEEFVEAMSRLGLQSDAYTVHHYRVRLLSEHRQEVLDEMLRLRQMFDPDSVLVPASTDLHQDHQVVHEEALRAFRDITVWGYELPWNHIMFTANGFVMLERRHVETKWRVLESYRSQIDMARPYFAQSFVESLARVRGTQVKTQYAEAFEIMRMRL